MNFKQIDEYFKRNPKLEKKYRKLLEERSPEFLALEKDLENKLKKKLPFVL